MTRHTASQRASPQLQGYAIGEAAFVSCSAADRAVSWASRRGQTPAVLRPYMLLDSMRRDSSSRGHGTAYMCV
jgi:hypothetical protein